MFKHRNLQLNEPKNFFFFENSGINIQVCMVQCERSIQAEVFSLRVTSERRRNKGNLQFIELSAAIIPSIEVQSRCSSHWFSKNSIIFTQSIKSLCNLNMNIVLISEFRGSIAVLFVVVAFHSHVNKQEWKEFNEIFNAKFLKRKEKRKDSFKRNKFLLQ